jgi:nitric oxide synthase oxygenase domain/subunit
MRFVVRYLAVFKPEATPAETLADLARGVYEDEIGDSPEQEFINARLRIEFQFKRPDGQMIVPFLFTDDRQEDEASRLHEAFVSALANESSIEHILKFADTFQMNRYRNYATELYELEMKIREAMSFVFIETYGDGYYDLLQSDRR